MGFTSERLRLAGHKVVRFDFNKARPQTDGGGIRWAQFAFGPVKNLSAPSCHLDHVPSGDPVDHTIARLEPLMERGDTFIDVQRELQATQRRHAA